MQKNEVGRLPYTIFINFLDREGGKNKNKNKNPEGPFLSSPNLVSQGVKLYSHTPGP